MPLTGDPIKHHPCHAHLGGAMVAEAPHEGRQGSSLTGGLHHQHHWQIEELGDGGRTAVAAGTPAIK